MATPPGFDWLGAGLSVGSQIFDTLASREAAGANQDAIDASNRQRELDRQAMQNAFTGIQPGGTVVLNDQGGYDVSSPGWEALAEGDPARAMTLNRFTSDPEFQPKERAFFEAGLHSDAIRKQSELDNQYQNITKQLRRAGGGVNNSGFNAAGVEALGRFALDNTANIFKDTETAFSNQGGPKVLQQLAANMMPKVASPGSPNIAAGSVFPQMPEATFAPDVSGSIFPGSVSNVFQGLQASNDRAQLIRQLGDAGAFGRPA
jgi:hypothetical protein